MNEIMKDIIIPNNANKNANNNTISLTRNSSDKIISMASTTNSIKNTTSIRPVSAGCSRKLNNKNQGNYAFASPPLIEINSNNTNDDNYLDNNDNNNTKFSVKVHQGFYNFINSFGINLNINENSSRDINSSKFNGFIEDSVEVSESFLKVNLNDYNLVKMNISCNDINISNNVPAYCTTELLFHLLAPTINNNQQSMLLLSIISDTCRSLLV
jgi:hypothetical protein